MILINIGEILYESGIEPLHQDIIFDPKYCQCVAGSGPWVKSYLKPGFMWVETGIAIRHALVQCSEEP